MTQAPARPMVKREDQVIAVLMDPKVQEQIKRALPRAITPERFGRMVMTSIRKTPKLALCDQRSLLSAMMELAQLGLEPDTPLGHAWMIPYGSVAQVVVGFKGMIALAERGARISMNAEAVYEGDRAYGEWDYALGSEPYIQHKPVEDLAKRGKLINAYSVARFPDGRPPHFKVINQADIDEAKASSSAYRRDVQAMQERPGYEPQSPWFRFEASQWRKTAIRRHATFLPLSAEFARVMALEDQVDRGEIQVFDPASFDPSSLPAPDPDQQAESIEERLKDVKSPPEPQKLEPYKDVKYFEKQRAKAQTAANAQPPTESKPKPKAEGQLPLDG